MKSIYIKVENPTLWQRFVVVSANLLLWLAIKLYGDDEEKLRSEVSNIIISAREAL